MDRIQRAFLKTPIGYLEITGSGKGIRSLTFLNFKVRAQRVPSGLKPCIGQLEAYFKGLRKTFDLELDLKGTEFQMRVWEEIQKIPYGTAISYHELALRTGNDKALRAVGGANGRNPISIIIPCHRVVGHDGKLVGYAGGLWRKKWLLEHEHAFVQRDLFYMKL